jgi:hypothetical protein
MQDNEVPQDNSATLGGFRKALYARGADGRIHTVASTGWEAEEAATLQAVDECNRQITQAHADVVAGRASPLRYHMLRARMDETLLAQTVGLGLFGRWRVRRHLRPETFAKLAPRLLARYAEALGLTMDQLQHINPQEP